MLKHAAIPIAGCLLAALAFVCAPSASTPADAAKAASSASVSASNAPSGAETATPPRLTRVQFVDSGHGFAAGTAEEDATSRLWRTADGGRTWASFPIEEGMREATFSFADEKNGWAIGPSECNQAGGDVLCGRMTILRTEDGGRSWRGQWTVADPRAGGDAEIQAVDRDTAFVRVRSAIGKTTDGGKTWLDASIENAEEAAPYHISFADAATGYAVGRLGTECPDPGLVPSDRDADCRAAVWKTKDGGRSWTLQRRAPKLGGEWTPAAVQFVDAGKGFALFVNPETRGSLLYATDNGGVRWKLRSDKLPGIRPYPAKLAFVSPRVGYVPLRTGAGPVEGGLMKTTDGGSTLVKLEDPRLVSVEDADFLDPQTGWIVAMNPDRPGSTLLLGTKDGGASWTDFTPR
ncbi:WD40/YVTN/BNR-like repeat-containing protein [Cohnella massiliensis]|uniref:WD40/YVTN/BNR-like repeat-containing protein n=1 Tax=Cohnella massiliensis TaxID=1816691 RepID=UPI0009BA49A2|nr:YCF48-related protein [Cohnella massiliensis]